MQIVQLENVVIGAREEQVGGQTVTTLQIQDAVPVYNKDSGQYDRFETMRIILPMDDNLRRQIIAMLEGKPRVEVPQTNLVLPEGVRR